MKNEDVIKYFLVGKVAFNSSQSLSSTGDKLYSYATCIAQHYNDKILFNTVKYSSTTSHHQTLLRKHAIQSRLLPVSKLVTYHNEIITIPRGVNNLEQCMN